MFRQELEHLEGIEIVGEAENGAVALREISVKRPDLVFLDIQMPVMGGFELLTHLTGRAGMPVIVMITAYDQPAIRAFEAGAVDYLLKPVNRQPLQHAVDRARRLHRDPLSVAESVATLQEIAPVARTEEPRLRSIVGKAGEEYFLLNPNKVLAFRANGELVWIITAQSRYLATQNLKTIEERLQSSSFRRVHRNALVNVNEIWKMSIISSQRWLITLNNGEELVVSKSRGKNVRDILHW
jgi:DNA-binding LytR/AlgR family response regulator